jgi:bifunctional UDP-N-acetylglucosamine pyrophosphorylase/glucosamine-1-phosphate N-acetyltransferase
MNPPALIVPAAGLGSRLGADVPKFLVPVAGVPMIDRLRVLYEAYVSQIVLIVHPSAEQAASEHVRHWPVPVRSVVQPRPTGMLDAILMGAAALEDSDPSGVWITWCDQVAVDPRTVRTLAETTATHPGAALVMPTVARNAPYIHLDRDVDGRIVRVLHRREGDAMPRTGESDMGLFALSPHARRVLLPAYAREVEIGASTGERNFLPFIGWLAGHGEVVTFAAVDEMEAVGVNTPDELAAVERYLTSRAGRGPSS